MKLFFPILFFFAGMMGAIAQQPVYLALKQQRISHVVRNYYVSNVADDRAEQDNIGDMTGSKLALKGGVARSVTGYIANNLRQNKAGQPVELHFTDLACTVVRKGGQYRVEATMAVKFYAGGKELVEYSGKGSARTGGDPGSYIEGFIRQGIASDLEKFDTWWDENKNEIPLAPDVKVVVSVGRTTDKPDLLVYSLNRPLAIDDFKGPVQNNGNEAAATASGSGLAYSVQTEHSQLVVRLSLTPCFNKEQSWFKRSDEDARVLAHEQAHMDITAIGTCQLANAIRNTAFTQKNYKKLIEQLQQQSRDSTTREQNAYDSETDHGLVRDRQIEWQTRVRNEVRKCGCY